MYGVEILESSASQSYLTELLPLAAYAVRAPYGVIAWYNSRAAQLWGRSPVVADTEERFCGAHKLFFSNGAYMAHCDSPVAAALYSGVSTHEQEVIIERSDGCRITVSVHIDPVRDSSGAIVGAVNFFHDISEQRQSERALRESEEQYRTLSETLEHQVFIRTQKLEHQSKELRDLSARLLQAQDAERRHIARELHDSVGQLVALLTMNLDKLSQDVRLSGSLQDSQEIARRLSAEIRTMSYLLHPPLLDEAGLCRAIGLYIEGLSERSGIDIDLNCPENVDRLPSDLEMAVFRIVQECLTNVHRHSGSKTASIRLVRNGSTIAVDVQDHGRGIPPDKLAGSQARPGVGLAGMQERVRHFGGTVEIKSSGKGTKVSVAIPIGYPTDCEMAESFFRAGNSGQSA